MASGTQFPFAAYWSWNTNPTQQKWKIGVGVYTPYANRANWDSTWAGRYVLNSTKLNTINIQPTFRTSSEKGKVQTSETWLS